MHRLEAEEGKHVELAGCWLVSDGKTITVGNLPGRLDAAKVLSHGKGDKVLVFKKKRRIIPETERPPPYLTEL